MNFDALQRRVRRAEAVVQVRMDETVRQWDTLEAAWRRSWTPGRILIAGLAGGFVAGRLEPGGAFSGARWLQMIGSVSGLVASAQASIATLQEAGLAAAAAATAEAAGDDAPQADPRTPAGATPAAAGTPPQAAAAATELSES
ncbi:protein sip-5 [Stenotrophomonas acidaminiphila]|uniref:protein sip-5 n=1 Tax=Stenotrophomonas TaxID=40323 RepID=UPI001DFB1248|nr:protein sip-5 [Stenotrophomonas acidaminiphila]MPS35824.1 protein sip-5 [Stenotrophomonas sp.]